MVRSPALMSAVTVMPGLSTKPPGTSVHLKLIYGHTRLEEYVVVFTLRDHVATLRLLVTAEAVRANEADRPFSHAILNEWKCVELDCDLLAGKDVTSIGSRNPGFDFQRRISRHQRDQRLTGLHD